MSNMINFRADPSEVTAIDRAAKQLGLNRSDFIRRAIKDFLKREPEVAVEVRKARNGECIEGKAVRDCTSKSIETLATGVRQCQVCGKRGS